MPRNLGSLILKLLVVSFVVGWGLTLFDITPLDLLKDLTGTIGLLLSCQYGQLLRDSIISREKVDAICPPPRSRTE